VVEEINISKIAVSKISFDDTNPNILTKEQMKSLKLVMEKFGFLAPVILNKDLQVIDGEHRVRVYQELGKKTIPAYVIDVNTINKKMLRQLMNKLRGEHDKQKDAEEFKLIFEAGKLNEFSNLLAAQTEDFQAILERKFDIGFERAEEQEVPGIPDKPKSKVGDIYQLGKHRIMCGDSTNQRPLNIIDSKMKPKLQFYKIHLMG
jgi:ParB-like chromosome segregation protein Spo0J